MVHFVRTSINIKTIPQGSNRFNDELFPSASEIPSRLFIFFLENGQFNGDVHKNPFCFQRYFLKLKKFVPEAGKDVYIKSTSLSVQGQDLSGKSEIKYFSV